jgi:hypothetical protein
VLSSDIPQLMASLPTENSPLVPTTTTNGNGSSNPFPSQSDGWSIAAVKAGFDDVFEGLNPVDGKLAGQHVSFYAEQGLVVYFVCFFLFLLDCFNGCMFRLRIMQCMGPLQNTGVKDDDLRKIWELVSRT